ncbi:MAG: PKD domain-containing protein, partial [Rhodothermales bacterium]|nr:PKD domain-containing protein [Rhodothermales bacterium]
SISQYSWAFGDGASASGVTASHTYSTPGTYTLVLTVTDDDGATNSTSTSITVTGAGNSAPVATFSATPMTGTAPLAVTFNGGGSTDSDGTIQSYSWSFGDTPTGATGETVQHTYVSPGVYSATLTVTDDDGAFGSNAVEIVVTAPQNVPPIASFTAAPSSGTAPLLVSLDASQSSDSDGTLVSYSWSFGDGATGSGQSGAHTYTSPGDYTLQLTVTDDDGASNSQSVTVTVNEGVNEAPAANFSATPLSGNAPLLVSADASASTDADGTIVSYAWSYGDGTTGTGQAVDHTYTSPGTYSLRLTVTDDDGAVNASTVTITVVGGGNQSPSASFVATPLSGNAPLTVTGDASASTDPDGSIVSHSWDFGDGVTGSGETISHTYLTAGTFTLMLTVTDNDGQVSTTSQTVRVNSASNLAPLASFSASVTSGTAPLLVLFDASASADPDGTITSYSWSYGNGVNGTGVTAAHTFVEPGNFVVRLTVTDDVGGVATSERLIQVTSDIGAQPDLVLRLSLDEVSGTSLNDESGKGQQASLMNGATFDAAGGIEGGAVRFDGIDDLISVADNAELNLSSVTERTISAWFRVEDRFVASRKQVIYEQGGVTRGLSIYVHNGSLYVMGWNDQANESDWGGTFIETGSIESNKWHHVALTLDGSSTTLQPGRLKAYLDGAVFGSGPGSQIWAHQDDIGIGAANSETRFHDEVISGGSANGFRGSIDEIRVYDAILTEGEIQLLASFSGQSINQAPTSVFVLNPTTAQAPANISFDASGSADSDGSIVTYEWDFGDTSTGNGRTTSHRYDTAGTYDIQLAVTDDAGSRSTSNATLVVTAASGNTKPIAAFSTTPIAGSPRSIRFDASASSDADGVLDQFIWDFGDGAAQVGQVVTHDYENGGVYVVQLTVVDNLGGTTVKQETIEVETSLPEALQPSNIGPLGANSTVNFENEQWRVAVRGAQWDPRLDAALFVHRPVNNDVEVVVRVDSVGVEDSLMFVGVSVRGGLSPTAANATVSVLGGDEVVFTYRAANGGWEVESNSAEITLPLWVRVSRKRTRVIGAYSTDGVIWTELADQPLPIEGGVQSGLFARSNDPNRIAFATMSDFSVVIDDDVLIDVPNDYVLSNSFPNPFGQTTQLTLSLSQQEDVLIDVYDIAGRQVAVLQDGPLAPNTLHRVFFDGSGLASGLYLIRFRGESFLTTRKATLIR